MSNTKAHDNTVENIDSKEIEDVSIRVMQLLVANFSTVEHFKDDVDFLSKKAKRGNFDKSLIDFRNATYTKIMNILKG